MSDAPSDLDRALRFIEQADDKCGAIWLVWEYGNRVRGFDIDIMRDDWAAIRRLIDRAAKRRKDRDAG